MTDPDAGRIRRRTRGIGIAATTLLAACVAGDAPGSGNAVRDSAGVVIVENRAAAWADAGRWTVAAEPAVRIGRIDGPAEYQLSRVIGATRLSDGRIAVADAGTHQLHFYDAAGGHLETVGGEGEGPGEFVRPGSFRRFEGDSLLVHDFGTGRTSVLDPDGRFVRSFTLESVGTSPARPTVALSGGRLAARIARRSLSAEFRARAASGTVFEGTTLLMLYTMDGAPLDTIGEFPLPERYVKMGGGSISILNYPFARTLVSASFADRLYVGWSGEYEIRRYGPGGALDRIIRLAREPRAVTEEDLARIRDDALASASNEDERRERERLFRDMEVHATLPAFDDFVVDAGGHLWVERPSRPGADPAEWDVFDPDGRWLGTVDLPDGLDVYEIGDDYVIGKVVGELDVERVVVFDLTRAEA